MGLLVAIQKLFFQMEIQNIIQSVIFLLVWYNVVKIWTYTFEIIEI